VVGATGFEPVTPSVSDPTSLHRPVHRRSRDRQGSSESRRWTKVPPPDRSHDPSRFYEGRVDPYSGRLLPICCPPPRLTFVSATCSGRLCAPAARPVAVGSIPDYYSNISSIACLGGDLAGPGPADRSAAAAVRGAARRRPDHHPRSGRQRRTLHLRRQHQDLEPDAAGAPAPARAVRPPARRLPRPPTKAPVAPTAKHWPNRDDGHLQEPRWRRPTSKDT
jgi:hypothetical protein